ncbi:hypothetical protein BMS3Bbin06_00493 [bacterium BMS3Bbin06]|nr:hypothetical protein BMS3Abin08_02115 [bacterium BMS3Abin08]GBE33977.1 hypothetical protein BMS3Bbin06_00493 [bacterium BMS3Bbin06]HDO36880.1 hypothetical protein [Nitrospirota bacterium]HDY71568.1 hypothetical protein [Nitrospirota bacterium]
MKFISFLITLILGIAIGISGYVIAPEFLNRYIPSSITKSKTVRLKGTVIAKGRKGASLLLTVNSPEGAMLVTFTRKVNEIELLVNKQDLIELSIKKYGPFIKDPRIIRVIKPSLEKAERTLKGPEKATAPAEKPPSGKDKNNKDEAVTAEPAASGSPAAGTEENPSGITKPAVKEAGPADSPGAGN